MEPKKIALLVGALIVAAITAVMAKNMFSGASAPKALAIPLAAPKGPEIMVATRSLPVGTIIEPDSFRYQPWPKELIQNAYYLKGQADPNSLAGTVVRAPITAGQPLTQGSLVKPGDRGFLAAALGPGMRAVTVKVSDISGVAGFVFPGDRVDLVLTQTVQNHASFADGGGGPPLKASETIIRNLRVLAADQHTTSEDEKGNKEIKRVPDSVTLEVTPRIAEKIAVAQTIGQLSLSLRSIADNTAELERAIAAGEIKVPEGSDPKAEKTMKLAIASRPVDTNPTFVTGADVSRFQRRSVPKASVTPARPQFNGGGFGGFGQPQNTGPSVRVFQGDSVTVVPVGGK
jgi:Flp pilus assembly protein CpaB